MSPIDLVGLDVGRSLKVDPCLRDSGENGRRRHLDYSGSNCVNNRKYRGMQGNNT